MKDKTHELQPEIAARPCEEIVHEFDDGDEETVLLCANMEMAASAISAVEKLLENGCLWQRKAVLSLDELKGRKIFQSELEAARELASALKQNGDIRKDLPEWAESDPNTALRNLLSDLFQTFHMKSWEALEAAGVEFSVETEKLDLDPDCDFVLPARQLGDSVPLRKGKRPTRIGLKGEIGELRKTLKRLAR